MPTLIIDTQKCRENIRNMDQKADAAGVVFRPHFKTHQSIEIAELFKNEGITAITVSSVTMAKRFIALGFLDVTIAFPVNILEIDTLNLLAKKAKLNLLVESVEAVHFLGKNLQANAGLFVKVDAGYGRTGIAADNFQHIAAVLKAGQGYSQLKFIGFLAHFGQTYQAKTREEVETVYNQSMAKLSALNHAFIAEFPGLIISIGDTPSCSIMPQFTGAHEIRPGNFVYFDAMQLQIGSCELNQVAAIMACPVVAIHPDRNQMVIYGGAVHFSKEALSSEFGDPNYGLVVNKIKQGDYQFMEDAVVKKLSQEHGTIEAPASVINTFKIGDLVYIVPVHSCLTANLMKGQTLYV